MKGPLGRFSSLVVVQARQQWRTKNLEASVQGGGRHGDLLSEYSRLNSSLSLRLSPTATVFHVRITANVRHESATCSALR